MRTLRILSSYLKNRPAGFFNPLKRRFHSTCYMRSGDRRNVPVERSAPVVAASWRSYILPGAVLGGFGGLVLFLHYNDERRAIPKGQGVKFERSSIQGPIIGGPFSLIGTDGRFVTEQNFLGNWVLLYFGYTSSPDVGPAEVQKMSKTINILGSKQDCKILPVFVSIDPQRDNPSHLRAYIREIDPSIVGLTGHVTAVRQMAQEYRVFFRKVDEEGGDYLVESSDNMYLMNPNMEVVRSFGVEYDAEDLAEAIEREVKKAGNRHSG
ncbi:protein SCO1 homolog 2, mitochondrial [Ipomoea triloba]|uniref:protein SCO1 homolog 2, mitochondrial n=1 Tax=Ipomoea triloba TaxID=35885 RepID=UPI00125E42F8|nr:protein SCO1 homolog 2, mitochondrial [Ipomoea triloba]